METSKSIETSEKYPFRNSKCSRMFRSVYWRDRRLQRIGEVRRICRAVNVASKLATLMRALWSIATGCHGELRAKLKCISENAVR